MKIFENNYNNKTITTNITSQINNFILANSYNCNSLFLSPVFADDYVKKYNLEYQYIIFSSDNEICALKLIFLEFKFYQRLANKNKLIIFFIKPILKFFFPIKKWFIPILFLNNISKSKRIHINNVYKNKYLNNKNIYHSPINTDINVQNFLNWGTYLLDLSSKNYEKIYKNYNNNLKKNIKAFSFNSEFHVTKINIFNSVDLDRYVVWIKKTQKRYRKSIFYDSKSIKDYKIKLNHHKFVFEIFILQNKSKDILSSLTIYGDKHYVNEYEANYLITLNKINFSTHDILRDEAIKYCLDHNIKYFDFSGFNPNAKKGTKEYNIKFSKSKFNGKIIKLKILNNFN